MYVRHPISVLPSTCFFFQYYGDHRYLHSFPTRRSSDLFNGLEIDLHQAGKSEGLEQRCLEAPGKQQREDQPASGPSPRHQVDEQDRKSTRLNSSHVRISYAVFCLKKKNKLMSNDVCMYAIRSASCPRPVFFFNTTATTDIYTLSLHDALPISSMVLK